MAMGSYAISRFAHTAHWFSSPLSFSPRQTVNVGRVESCMHTASSDLHRRDAHDFNHTHTLDHHSSFYLFNQPLESVFFGCPVTTGEHGNSTSGGSRW
jgi:hypothetical protein